MSSDPHRPRTEIVHTLFIDIVAYSLGTLQQQQRAVQTLHEAVRAAPEFQRAEADGDLLCLGQGDGVALVFFHDPAAPARCAVEITHALGAPPRLPVRMGLHSGPVTRSPDITAHESVFGGGINMAQRVMDCGDAGHILLSRRCAEDLLEFEEWAPALHDLGEATIKHGERLRLYSLVTEKAGNPALPTRLRPAEAPAAPRPEGEPSEAHSPPAPLSPAPPAAPALKIALLYKRNSPLDERLLLLLEQALGAEGCDVFVDRHLSIGVEWAREIERQVCAADAVVPLLSEAAVHSEMLEYEVQTAHRAAQVQNGKPRLLPVRVAYPGPLPEPLAAMLDPLQYTLWQGPEDDARLVADLLHALRNPVPPPPPVARGDLETVGGAVPLDSRFYITRPVDAEFLSAIERRDSIVLVKGARQMGKTSLLARGLHQARQAGAKVVLTDFQTLNEKHLASADALLMALATLLAGQLGLAVHPRETWDADLGANMNMDWFVGTDLLGTVPEPVVWGLDEVDRLFACDFGGEVFGLFRSWHNRRALDPSGPWSRLTLAIAYATEAHLFITDLNQSPFNVGTRLALEDFTLEQVGELNHRYGGLLRSVEELGRFYRLVSGHPYLVRRGLDEMVARGLSIGALEAQADRDEGLFGDHLRRLLVSLTRDAELTEVVRGVLRGGPCPTPESFYRLRAAGVLTGETGQDCRPRCQLYATYLARHLL